MQQLRLLGHTRIEVADQVVTTEFGGVKPRQLLELLALSHGTPVDKHQLAELLWEGRPPKSFAATLESHVSILRRHLTAMGLPRDVVRTVHTGYVLSTDLEVDLTLLRHRLFESAEFEPSERLSARSWLPDAKSVLLASSPHASWASAARQELRCETNASCRRRASVALARGAHHVAVELAERAQAAEPLSEATEQVLLRSLVAAGFRSDALWSFAGFRERLHDELGVEPSRETSALYLGILREEASVGVALHEEERAVLHRLLAQLPRVAASIA